MITLFRLNLEDFIACSNSGSEDSQDISSSSHAKSMPYVIGGHITAGFRVNSRASCLRRFTGDSILMCPHVHGSITLLSNVGVSSVIRGVCKFYMRYVAGLVAS